ncbi:Smr/MutS family protein [Elusimicrobiota bacterium]
MSKIKLDLHGIYNKGNLIEYELKFAINDAVKKKIDILEIIPGKGSGSLKKRVKRFLESKVIKKLYHRYKVDNKNFGRLFVYFRHKK